LFNFNSRKIVTAVLIFLFMGICGWFWRNREYVPFVSQPLSTAAAPFEYGVSRLAVEGTRLMDIMGQSVSNWKELDTLRRENGNLRSEQAAYSEILAENIRLKKLLDFKEGYKKYTMTGASVIARDYGGWTSTMVVDRGTDSGIQKYMPVIVPEGLVGYVSEVYQTSCRVQLLTDPRTSVGGIVQRPASRVSSIVKGSGNRSDEISFGNIPKEADVIKGDVIITSGFGGVYPKGLLIGTVSRVVQDTANVSQTAMIKPAVDFSRLEEVFIITDQIEKSAPEEIKNEVPLKEPAMNPNEQQAGGKQ
jgi:rod shape-determining protein MreC